MDITKLKGKQLDDATFEELSKYVTDLAEARDAARKESIDGRKAKDATIKDLKAWQEKAVEKLGLESPEGIEDLNIQGQAEAAKQFEAKVRKLERDLEAATKERDALFAKNRDATKEAILSKALGAHEFVDRDVVEAFISARLEWDGDELNYKGEGGKILSVTDGVAELVKTKPSLLKVPGDTGAGVPNNGTGGPGAKPELGGNRQERVAAIKNRFPNLPEK
jgi:hypothetical protein